MMPFKTILFATDFSLTSKVAFQVAAALARDYRARIIAVHVIEPVRMGFSEFTSYVSPEEDKGLAMEQLQAIHAPAPTVTMEYRLLEGDPATVIAETAQDAAADLIVMGTHGRSGLPRLVMGSVAEDVLRRAPCPVLTVRDAIAEKVAVLEEEPEAVVI